MIVVGAGMAGLLAGNMLRHRSPILYEVQDKLPNNHSAVLRFKTPSVGDVLNIPFKKVHLVKTTVPWRNVVADALAYSFKNTGVYRSDRSITQGTVIAERWVAPSNLIQRMAAPLNIKYGHAWSTESYGADGPIISTLPMPTLMTELNYPHRETFSYISGTNVKATIRGCDAYVSIVCPDPVSNISRISITGNELIAECYRQYDVSADSLLFEAIELLGLRAADVDDFRSYPQKYAKINPIDDKKRKEFLFWATDKYNIFSLGRFATWRPGLLLDDLVQDLRKIDSWIEQGHYAIARQR